MLVAWLLTARQYGEVVLPDAGSGQGPDTPPQAGPESCHAVPRASVVSGGGARRGSLPRRSEAHAGAHFLPSRYKAY